MAYTFEGKIDEIIAGLNNSMDGDAAVGNVLASKTFFNTSCKNEDKRTGTMPNNAGDVASVAGEMGSGTTLKVTPAQGYTDGVDDKTTIDLTTVDADLVTGNIKAGITLFGVAGSTSVVDTSDADAVAGDIATGKTAYVNGVKITGTA